MITQEYLWELSRAVATRAELPNIVWLEKSYLLPFPPMMGLALKDEGSWDYHEDPKIWAIALHRGENDFAFEVEISETVVDSDEELSHAVHRFEEKYGWGRVRERSERPKS